MFFVFDILWSVTNTKYFYFWPCLSFCLVLSPCCWVGVMVMASLLFLSFILVLCSCLLFLSSVICFVLSCLDLVGLGCSGDGLGYSSHFFLSFVLVFCCFFILILIPSLRAPNYPCLSLPLPAFLLQLVICLSLHSWLFFCSYVLVFPYCLFSFVSPCLLYVLLG